MRKYIALLLGMATLIGLLPGLTRAAPEVAGVRLIAMGDSLITVVRTDGSVWEWGGADAIPAPVPSDGDWIALAVGADHRLGVRSDGTVAAWGRNGSGQLGAPGPDFSDRAFPTPISGLERVVAVAAGAQVSYALRQDGTVATWGKTGSLSPVDGLSQIVAIAARGTYLLALGRDGTVWAWGNQACVVPGTQAPRPVRVPGLTEVSAISSGLSHALALRKDGTVWSWGSTADDRLCQKPNPVLGVKAIVQVAAGADLSLALDRDGRVWSWARYQVSAGSREAASPEPPAPVSGLDTVTAIAAGHHALALETNGRLMAWGMLPVEGTIMREAHRSPIPLTFPGPLNDIAHIVAGPGRSFAIGRDGTVWAWGINNSGTLGTGSSREGQFSTAHRALPALSGAIALAFGFAHSLALHPDGTVLCWGHNTHGECGSAPSQEPIWTPSPVTGVDSAITVAAGLDHSVVAKRDGSVWSWGHGAGPHQVRGLAGVKAVYASGSQSYAVTSDGAVWTWESQRESTLAKIDGLGEVISIAPSWGWALALRADGTVWRLFPDQYAPPYQVRNLSGIKSVTVGSDICVALDAGGRAVAWDCLAGAAPPDSAIPFMENAISVAALYGYALVLSRDGLVYELGTGPPSRPARTKADPQRYAPLPVLALPPPLVGAPITTVRPLLTAGLGFSAAVGADGTVWGWGTMGSGAQGFEQPWPVPVPGMSGVVSLASGWRHLLAALSDGRVAALGANSRFELGDGTRDDRTVPIIVPGITGVTQVAAGHSYSLALREDGTVWSWGTGPVAVPGGVETSVRREPAPVVGVQEVIQVAAGFDHALALLRNGTVMTWGYPVGEPTSVEGLRDVTTVAAGFRYSAVVNVSGSVLEWGDLDRPEPPISWGFHTASAPTEVEGLTEIHALAVGSSHSVALRKDGTVWTWGNGKQGRLGNSRDDLQVMPEQVQGLGQVGAIAAGENQSLALSVEGFVYTWGTRQRGADIDGAHPKPVEKIGPVVQMAAGAFHSLAVDQSGQVWSWGSGAAGQLGNSARENRRLPGLVPGLSNVRAVVASTDASLALQKDGSVWEWGGSFGWAQPPPPARVTGLGKVTAIAVGNRALALQSDGTVWIWTIPGGKPAPIPGLNDISAIAAAGDNAAALKMDGTVWQVTVPTLACVRVDGLADIAAIAASPSAIYAINRSGELYRIRSNQVDWILGGVADVAGGEYWPLIRLTGGSVHARGVTVPDMPDVVAVAAGMQHFLALRSDATLWAWGQNDHGQLGVEYGRPVSLPGLNLLTQ